MSIAWGIMALALAGSEPPEGPAKGGRHFRIRIVRPGGNLPVVGRLASNAGIIRPEPEQISYEVRVVDTPAAEWREAFYRHCKRVGREGRSTVWTVEEKTAAAMLDRQLGLRVATSVVQAPEGQPAFAGASATIDTRHARAFVVDVDRVADGPVDHAPRLASPPSVDEIREGTTVSINGRTTAAGVRAHVKLDSTWVGHVAQAKTTETIQNKEYGKTSVTAGVELPQVVEAKVEGDYEIPRDQMLLVSLGTATTVDARNQPVVMERLMMIAARPIVTEAEEARLGRHPVDGRVRPAKAEAAAPTQDAFVKAHLDLLAAFEKATERKKMPPLPSRSLLMPIGPDGKVVDLPPLPDDLVAEAGATESTSGPQASPQARMVRPLMRVDAKVAPARLEPAPAGVSTLRLDGRELASGRSQILRIPLGGVLVIELRARLVPAEQPE